MFAEFDPAGWIELVICGHPPPLRLSTDGELVPLAPAAFTAPLGLHPDLRLSTFSVRTGDRLLFFTDGLLEARDRAGRFFRVDQQIQALSRPDLQAAASSPAVTRYVWRIAPIVSMTDDEVVELIGPAIQRYVDLMI